ncbi:TrgA family protein, partial [Pseudorhodobacter sp.]|uniref:TrgA family protein n=1 Tax=Pseudorhodobacter sp. TaxID=1934400 RepID=UPI0026471447
MPTISKLVAAFAFAIVAAFAAELFKPQMPEGTQFGYFTVICAVIGLICGWRVMGNLVGRGYRAAMGYGL